MSKCPNPKVVCVFPDGHLVRIPARTKFYSIVYGRVVGPFLSTSEYYWAALAGSNFG